MTLTALYAGCLGLFHVILACWVIYLRRYHRVGIGAGDHFDLKKAVRVHGNFIENVPLALILLGLLEVNGEGPVLLHILGSCLLLGRVLHAYGLSRTHRSSFGRFTGTALSLIVIALSSARLLLIQS